MAIIINPQWNQEKDQPAMSPSCLEKEVKRKDTPSTSNFREGVLVMGKITNQNLLFRAD